MKLAEEKRKTISLYNKRVKGEKLGIFGEMGKNMTMENEMISIGNMNAITYFKR